MLFPLNIIHFITISNNIIELSQLEDVHPIFFSFAVNKLITDNTQNIFIWLWNIQVAEHVTYIN